MICASFQVVKTVNMERQKYQKPEIEVISVEAERGFAASVTGEVEGFDREDWNE